MKRILASMVGLLAIVLAAALNVTAQKARAATVGALPQQPLYTEFRGVRLGMTSQEVRAKLGTPALKDDDMDYFVLSDNLTAQIAYDTAHKAKTISVDYAGGAGAPDYLAVVGPGLETREDGSVYKMVRYEAQGFWVSYNRTAGPTVVVTITIAKK